MKKLFSGILVLFLAVAMFADSKDCVDGIIEVADSGKFPSGHFGQAAGYLPGDSVFVTNPETGVTLQFLNLGTLDSADGIVILLSDESAKTLGIKKGSGMRCKLNMRYGGFDETVTGQAVIDAEDAALAKKSEIKEAEKAPVDVPAVENPAPVAAGVPAVVEADAPVPPVPVAGVPLFKNDETPAEENGEVIIEEIPEEMPAPTEEVAEEVPETIEEEVPAEPVADEEVSVEPVAAVPARVEEVVAEEEPVAAAAEEAVTEEEPVAEEEAVAEEETVAEEEPVAAEEAFAEEPVEDYEDEDAPFAETREAVEQPSPAEVAETEEFADVEEPMAEEVIEEEAIAEEAIEEEPIEEVHSEEPEVAVAEPAEENEDVPVPSEAVEAEELPALAEETRAAEPETAGNEATVEEVVEITEEPAVEETVAEESVEDEYAPIVLVPAEPVAPEASEEDAKETRAAEPIEEEPVEVVAESEAVPEAKPVEFTSYKDLIVESESSLKKGYWYVQIASLGNAENIEKTVRKYSKYPMVLIPNGKGACRVLVGPLGMDEYAAVLAKFKAFGYKDAFLKKK